MLISKINIYFYFFILIIVSSCKTENNIITTNCENVLIDSVSSIVVIDVIDGDTFKIKLQNDIFSVRVLNLDCFETRRGDRLNSQAENNNISVDSAYTLGIKARETATNLLLNKEIKLVRDFDNDNFDTYNRLLRNVYIDTLNYANYIKSLKLNAAN